MAATIPIFDGTNYEFWKVKMKTLFESKDLWDTVQNEYAETNQQQRINNAAALSQIQQGVSDLIFPCIKEATTAKQAWDTLQAWDTPPEESHRTQPQPIRELARKFASVLPRGIAREIARVLPRGIAREIAEEIAGVLGRPANIEKSKEINLIVATLIATVTFAAGITMPGGYINDNKDPNQGMAILTRKAAFAAFVITDTIALTLSVFAVLIHLFMTDNPKLLKKQFGFAFLHTAYAMIAMLLAFITATYAVLGPSSLSISVCVIPATGFVLFCQAFEPLADDLADLMSAQSVSASASAQPQPQ